MRPRTTVGLLGALASALALRLMCANEMSSSAIGAGTVPIQQLSPAPYASEALQSDNRLDRVVEVSAAVEPGSSGDNKELKGCSVYGRLLSATGQPILRPPGQISVICQAGESIQAHARIKKDASYCVSALNPGKYRVTAWARGFKKSVQVVFLTASAHATKADFILDTTDSIAVYVTTPTGAPYDDTLSGGDMTMEAKMKAGLRAIGCATSQDSYSLFASKEVGTFAHNMASHDPLLGWIEYGGLEPSFVCLAMGESIIACEKPENGSASFVVSREDLLSGFVDIRVGIVDAETDAPPSSADVEFSSFGVRSNLQMPGNGMVEDTACVGSIRVEVLAEGYEIAEEKLVVEGGQAGVSADLGVVRLHRGFTVEGAVYSTAGSATSLGGARVCVYAGTQDLTSAGAVPYGTDDEGNFALCLRPGRYTMQVVPDIAGAYVISRPIAIDVGRNNAFTRLAVETPATLEIRNARSSEAHFVVNYEGQWVAFDGNIGPGEMEILTVCSGEFDISIYDGQTLARKQKFVILEGESASATF